MAQYELELGSLLADLGRTAEARVLLERALAAAEAGRTSAPEQVIPQARALLDRLPEGSPVAPPGDGR